MKPTTFLLRALLLSGLTVSSYGCKDFVNLTPQDIIPVSGFYKTEADIQAALTGAYGSMRSVYNGYFQFTELPSDNTRTINSSEVGYGQFDKLNWLINNTAIASGWNQHYTVIAGTNVTLGHADDVSYALPTTKAQIVGQAKFLRALMYFNLVRFFGDVPLVLTELKSQAEALDLVRTPAADVYAQIERDLTDAEAALPLSYNAANVGRATSGAAKALLGKVYLQEKKWALAEAKLAEVVALTQYQLLPDVNNVFGVGKDNNAEIIFACQYFSSGNGEGNSFAYNFAPVNANVTTVAGGSTNLGTKDLNDAFEAGDQRKAAFLTAFGTGNATDYYAKKFVYNVLSPNEGDNDWPIIRLADVVLMYAEALNNNGKTALAIPQLNRVRTRAGLAAKPLTLTTADTQLAIEQERRVELCFEGHRWHDLIRWGKATSTMQAFKTKYTTLDPANGNLAPSVTKELFPIPQVEVLLNSKLTQNPGY
ncbi:RagB/SusD family nutrient uptake outer membrane protein [Hymenobacter sp. BT523]|uniref:RagB/SusD family nutrient uptake outer membrane protein n=1 Tax=Hymenobacter sp. BT523 TaxID=2795725 RepID=UPI0018EA3F8E|nr:RagB/SusD family nutrient uptake outer membrane protein [Hymenobacter sp. BT523]MBJ6108708.1 RagB/SusD family nutrient uptake outer membrane protein [Hymenobacter sp. BT523]